MGKPYEIKENITRDQVWGAFMSLTYQKMVLDYVAEENPIMAEKPTPPPDSKYINWISLWQASGNDWSWMNKQNSSICSQSSQSRASKRTFIVIEILLTIALLLLARHIESSQNQRLNYQEESNFFESSLIKIEQTQKKDSFF